ncbi:patatin-like protein [Umezawaea sp. NPDC059074]|uniref:patatin-like protein n=1 Tax=Umezawaea sp. NPDC059074 TaxID=3346716 RepID=UPI0036917981
MAEVPQEQIRFAVVLNGGVSLAVWMGGVVLELDRLTRAGTTYQHLLSMVGCTARADVITGTSAGGINGAALAVSQVSETADLTRLRDLWAEQGRMEQLLRTPFQGQPVSLLRGDEFFLPRLQEMLGRLTTDFSPTKPEDRPVDLRITTTLLGGVPKVSYDDLGQALVQVADQGSFSFRRDAYDWATPPDETTGRDDFAAEDLPKRVLQMALAARSSASFPIAFEPSFIPVNGQSTPSKPDMGDVASWGRHSEVDRSRFAVDGGVLVNTPTREALEAIDRMPANGPVRRVMLLVFPHAEPEGPEPAAHVRGEVPSTVSTAVKVQGAWSGQGSRTYVKKIEEHNRLAASRRGGRNSLLERLAGGLANNHKAPTTVAEKAYQLADTLHEHYEDVRIRLAARDITTRQFAVKGSNSAGWSFERVRAAAESAQREWRKVNGMLPYVPTRKLPSTLAATGWHWGVTMADTLASSALDLLKRMVWIVPETHEGVLRGAAGVIADSRTRLHRVRAELRQLREKVDITWTGENSGTLNQAYWGERLGVYDQRMTFGEVGSIGADVRACVVEIGALVDEAQKILALIDDEDRLRLGGLAAWRALLTTELTPREARAGLVAGPEVWLSRLMALEISTACLADDARGGVDQAVELVQISLQTRNAFATRSITADDKAGGASLGRFSGFLKRSWRVNDWIWGRLDGATMLCKVIFDPQRLRRMDLLTAAAGESRADKGRARQRAHDQVDDLVDELFGGSTPELAIAIAAAKKELAGIYAEETLEGDLPPTAGALAELAAWGLHVRIIVEELPALRAAILADRNDGGDPRSRGELFLEEHKTLLARLDRPVDFTTESLRARSVSIGLQSLRAFDEAGIGREPISQEAGSDQLIRTAATAAAVAVTVADSKNSGLAALKPVTRVMRGAALLPYWTITGLTRGGKLAQFLGSLGFAVGGALLVLALFNLLPNWAVGPAAAIGGGTLMAAFGYAALRSGTLLHGLVLLSPVIPLGVIAIDRTRAALNSGATGEEAATGMVAVGGVALLVLALLVIGSLPAPIRTPFAVLKDPRTYKRVGKVLWRLGAVAAVGLAAWAVVHYELYDLDWLTGPVVVFAAVAAVAIGAACATAGGRSLQRWRKRHGKWEAEHAESPAAATAGWAVVYGIGFLLIAVVLLLGGLRFLGWQSVLATSLVFGLLLVLVTSWWVPMRARRAIVKTLVQQADPARDGTDAAGALLVKLESYALLYRFLVDRTPDDGLVLKPAALRVVEAVRAKSGQAASSATGAGAGSVTGAPTRSA